MNTLPGMQKPFALHKAWYDIATRREALDYFHAYRQMVNPPLKEGITVTQGAEGENTWHVHTDTKTYQTTNVAICTGHAARPFVPDTAKKLPQSTPSYTHRPIETPIRSQRQTSSSSATAAVAASLSPKSLSPTETATSQQFEEAAPVGPYSWHGRR